jgi:hypothetical protein
VLAFRGTPNSCTTSLSALSTTAIKDGHQGHPQHRTHHGHRSSSASESSTTTLDAERADRISRLAGLERVATTRPGGNGGLQNQAMAAGGFYVHPLGYFDIPPQMKERSTVGSASATGSIGGRTTWASSSDIFDLDRVGEDHDDGVSSNGGFSEEGNSSLVGFGEGAGSTISGPISTSGSRVGTTSGRQLSMTGGNTSPSASRGGGPALLVYTQHTAGNPMGGSSVPPTSTSPAGSTTPEPQDPDENDARMVDGMTFDSDVVDTAARPPPPVG